ncbi:hypothetical protein R1sor_003537 [Riccia sorocarpa]|uniref:Uncharacterized protein n=1 Tax=Riccia sorocarpa TaxID=122646 RepID=A0ABD3H1V6_9MARC
MEELAFESCGVLDLVPFAALDEDERQEQLEELVVRIAEYVEESIALEETILLEEDSEAFMEAQLRKQHLQECIEAISEYVEETIAIEEEEQMARKLEDCRKRDMEALVEAIEVAIAQEEEEEESKDVTEEYVIDLSSPFEEESSSGVPFLETWYSKKPRRAHATRIKTTTTTSTTAVDMSLKGTGSRKRDSDGNVRSQAEAGQQYNGGGRINDDKFPSFVDFGL